MAFERMTSAQYLASLGLTPGWGRSATSSANTGLRLANPLGGSSAAHTVRPPRKNEEEVLHRECADWIVFMTPRFERLSWTHHSPNGGLRSKAEAGRLKSMGVKKGYPDLVNHCASPGAHWKGFAVELKSRKGVLSVEQHEWLDMFEQEGYLTGVARTLDQFMSLMKTYLGEQGLTVLVGGRR